MSNDNFPTPHEFFVSVPMYKSYKWNDNNFEKVLALTKFTGSIDTYCVACKDRTLFTVRYPEMTDLRGDDRTRFQKPYICVIKARCSRTDEHIACYVFRLHEEDGITKIGQYPSAADAAIQGLKNYQKVLDNEHKQCLTKAIGLFSFGVGAGSIVYLRKIFEALIEEAHQEASKEPNWLAEYGAAYARLKMGNKVKSLHNFLPSDLVKHPNLYGFLSKGLHNLPEQECLRLFPMLRLAIEYILSKKLERQDEKLRSQELERFLNSAQV
ncbi:hypothetical protein IFT48_18390 [Pseudomonas fluorescens]|uniref:hypothetical protein n=1 Tax=Pseudomonas fluorescens TaxID=294 RepID=UPI001904200D|nr:hypothetical protein [Pseudomonas fluorescens]MBD8091968.1 hypothetical protein [Pseudomonas fluorescens]MBD8718275.1 hypothetical protein [Pseudomonas fluorescens]